MGAGQISGEKEGEEEEVDTLEERKHKGSDHRKGYEPKSIYPVTFWVKLLAQRSQDSKHIMIIFLNPKNLILWELEVFKSQKIYAFIS